MKDIMLYNMSRNRFKRQVYPLSLYDYLMYSRGKILIEFYV